MSKTQEKQNKSYSINRLVEDTKPQEKADGDLIRKWEDYLHKANFWRSMFLLQIPVTVFALIFASIIFLNRNITLNVPKAPLPGTYSIVDVPDYEFINFAVNFANLVFNYTPANIEAQYKAAMVFLAPTAAKSFAEYFLKQEVGVIRTTGVSQVFNINPFKTKVKRENNIVTVTLGGDRYRIVAGKETRFSEAYTQISMRTMPHNNLNPYGIMVVNFKDLSDATS